MVDLAFVKHHNMVAYLEKTEENADFHQILEFLTSSSINFALTVKKQIHANVDDKAVVVSESLVRRDLQLNDEDGTACLTTNEIFENLALMGYEPASNKLTFYKGLFSPQWKYLIHTILHCLSSKSTSCDQFSTNLASAVICLAKGQKFNFSKLIFDGKGFSGKVTPLFQNMLVPPVVVGEGSEQPPEPQPIPFIAPLEVLSQVTTVAASQPPKDPNTYRRTKRGRNTKVPQSSGSPNKVGDEAINEEMFDSVERAATTASSLEAEQASGNINKTQFTTTLNEPFFLELGSGSGPWHQEIMGGMQAQTRSEGVSNVSSNPPLLRGHTHGSGEDNMEHQIKLTDNVPNTPYDSPLPGVNMPGSDEGSLELNELMDLVTKLSDRVFDLEKVKTAQAKEIASLKRRVTKLEQRQRSRILKNHPFRFGSSRRQSLVDKGMAFVQEKDAENQGKISADDIEVVKGSGDTEVLDTEKAVNTRNKGKGILQETESVEKTKKKVQGDAQMERNAKVALRLQAELDEELRVERERQEEASKVAIVEMFNEVQVRIDVDYELAARMTQEEQEKYTIEERARLLAEFFERRKKQLAAKRAEAIRNKPPTKNS
ncbi:hypothetical protein Tco_1311411 [Tanacetum coccineum]